MFPVAVGQHARKKRIFRSGQPSGQGRPRIVLRFEHQRLATEGGRFDWLAGFRVLDGCLAPLMKNGFFTRLVGGLPPDRREEGHEAVIILLAPLFVGMVVALGALEPLPGKDLSNVLHLVLRFGHRTVPSGGRIAAGTTRGGNQFAHHLVIRSIAIQMIAEPTMKSIRDLGRGPFAFVAQQGGPLTRKILSVIGRRQEPVNGRRPLVRGSISQKPRSFGRRRQAPSEIQRDPPQERRIITQWTGWQTQSPKFGKNMRINKIALGRKLASWGTQRDRHAEDTDVLLITDHDRRITRQFRRRHYPGRTDFRHVAGSALKLRNPRNVAP